MIGIYPMHSLADWWYKELMILKNTAVQPPKGNKIVRLKPGFIK